MVAALGLAALALLLAWRRSGPRRPCPEVAIPDGTTIAFSVGKPVVTDTAEERAAIEKAVQAMEAAAKDVTFTSPTPPAAPPKKADAKK